MRTTTSVGAHPPVSLYSTENVNPVEGVPELGLTAPRDRVGVCEAPLHEAARTGDRPGMNATSVAARKPEITNLAMCCFPPWSPSEPRAHHALAEGPAQWAVSTIRYPDSAACSGVGAGGVAASGRYFGVIPRVAAAAYTKRVRRITEEIHGR